MKILATLNAQISSSHCSPAMPSSTCIKQMHRSSTWNRKGEKWLHIWAIKDNCQSNCLQGICNRRDLAVLWARSVTEMVYTDILTTARLNGVCISMRSMNQPSWDASMVGWLKNVISISLSQGASILAMKVSKYLLFLWYLKHMRAGRRTHSSDSEGKERYFWQGGKERKWSERFWRLLTLDNAFTNMSGEKYPALGILWSWISARSWQGKNSHGNEGMATLVKWRVRRQDPHQIVPGRVGCTLSQDRRTCASSPESGSVIMGSFSMSKLVTVRLMKLTWPDCFSAAMILSSSSRTGGPSLGNPPYFMMRQRAGQNSRAFWTGIL